MHAERALPGSELARPRPGTQLAAWLTVERAAYAAISLAALALRLYRLAQPVLSPSESAFALPAWQSISGRAFDAAGASPLLFQLQRLFFVPFGGGDAMARWPVALIGGLAPLLFWGLRDRLGRDGALAAALLWAVSPVAVFLGRLGLDFGLVPPLALAVLAALDQYVRSGHPRWLTGAAIALGLLLVAGPGVYTVIVAGLLALLVWPPGSRPLLADLRQDARRPALALLLTVGVAATGFFTLPSGLAMTTDLLNRWLRDLLPGGAAATALPGGYLDTIRYSAWDLVRRLLISEPLLLGAAIAGGVAAWRERESFGRFASLATLMALLAALLAPGRHPGDLGLVILGLTLLAGPALAWVVRSLSYWRSDVDSWLLFGLSLALLTALAIALPAAFSFPRLEDRRIFIAVSLVASLLCLALWGTYGWWSASAGLTRRVLPALWCVPLVLWGISQLVGLNYQTEPAHQSGMLAQTAGGSWPALHRTLDDLGGLYSNGLRETPVDLIVSPAPAPLTAGSAGGLAPSTDPLVAMLAWQLKEYRHLSIVQGSSPNPAPVAVTPLTAGAQQGAAVPVPETYSGSSYDLLQTWQPDSISGAGDWLRWVLYREAVNPPAVRQAVIWIDRGAMRVSGSRAANQPVIVPNLPLIPQPQSGGPAQ